MLQDHHHYETLDDFFTRRSVFVFGIIGILNIPSTLIHFMITGEINGVGIYTPIAISVASLIASYCAIVRKRAKMAGRIAVAIISISIVTALAEYGGLTGPVNITLAGIPVLAAFLLGSRDILYTSILLAFTIGSLFMFHHELPVYIVSEAVDLNSTTTSMLVLLLLGGGALYYLVKELEERDKILCKLIETQKHAATHDSLTGLKNRLAVNEYLKNLSIDKDNVDFYIIDLDGFKHINDTQGHAAGDELLVTVAKKLSDVCADAQLIARLGGDEFLVAYEFKKASFADESKSNLMGNCIAEAMHISLKWGSEEYCIAGSVGSANYPYDSPVPSAVMSKADLALYCAKNYGKAQYVKYKDKDCSDIKPIAETG